MQAMARSGSVGVILPTTAYILRLKPPPVRDMIAHGMIVGLGSDFNPNAYCMSMPMVMHLACVNLRMSLAESLQRQLLILPTVLADPSHMEVLRYNMILTIILEALTCH